MKQKHTKAELMENHFGVKRFAHFDCYDKLEIELVDVLRRDIKLLRQQLAESQRREKAAIEDLHKAANPFIDACATCKVQRSYVDCEQRDYKGFCMNYEWRGPTVLKKVRISKC